MALVFLLRMLNRKPFSLAIYKRRAMQNSYLVKTHTLILSLNAIKGRFLDIGDVFYPLQGVNLVMPLHYKA